MPSIRRSWDVLFIMSDVEQLMLDVYMAAKIHFEAHSEYFLEESRVKMTDNSGIQVIKNETHIA